MATLIRAATRTDRDAIVTVFLACWQRNYAEVLPQTVLDAMDEERAIALWDRVLTEALPGEVLVATGDSGPSGDVLGVTRFAGSAEGTGAIHSLYVLPDAQGQGLGASLLAAAEHALADAGCRDATLWVFRENTPSRKFYARQGWRPDGGQRVEAEFGEPEIRLRKSVEAGVPPLGSTRQGQP